MAETGFRFTKINHMKLLLGHCPNEHLNIFGFANQLRGKLDKETMTYTTAADCKECGCEVMRVDKVEPDLDGFKDGDGI